MIFVQADCLPEQGLDEALWVDSLAPVWPELRGIVAYAPVERGEAVAAHLRELRTIDRVVGVRRLLQSEDPGYFRDPAVEAGLKEIGNADLVFDACVRYWQLPALASLIRQAPHTRVVLDHLGKPPVAEGLNSENGKAWLASMREVADAPGVTVKLSGLAPEALPEVALAPQVEPFLAATLDVFGVDRVMLGSDWPVSTATRHRLGYADWFELLRGQLAVSPSELVTLSSRTATAAYSL